MNKIKKAITIISAAVMCAVPLAPAVSNNISFFNNTAITASASSYLELIYRNDKNMSHPSSNDNGYYNPNRFSTKVVWIQRACNWIADAYKEYNLSRITVDGYYGNQTKNAVRRIQELTFFVRDRNKNRIFVAAGIGVDGLAGPITVAKMDKLINDSVEYGDVEFTR